MAEKEHGKTPIPYGSLLASIILTVAGLTASFNALAGFISIGEGILITLAVMAVLILLNVQLRVEEIVGEED